MTTLTKKALTIIEEEAKSKIAKRFDYEDYNTLLNDLNQSPETNQQLITNI